MSRRRNLGQALRSAAEAGKLKRERQRLSGKRTPVDRVTFTVWGKPGAKERPRVTRRGAFTPRRTAHKENTIQACFLEHATEQAIPIPVPHDGPIRLLVLAYWAIPKSWAKRRREVAERETVARTGRPDCDNVLKLVMDGLNGLAWTDDAQVTDATVRKRYSWRPRMEVTVVYEDEEEAL